MDKMTMRWLLLFLCLGASTFGQAKPIESGGFEYQLLPTPQWVTLAPLPVPAKVQTQGSQYLLSDEQLNLTNGQYESYSRVAQRVTTEQSLEQASKISMLFNPEFQTFTLHHVKVKRGEQIIDLTNKSKIELFQREEHVNNNIYDGKVTVFIVIPDIRIGDIVEYASTTTGKNPVFGDKNFATFSLGWSVAVQSSQVRVVSDIARPLEYKVHNLTGEPEVVRTASTIEYQWRQSDVPAILNEQHYPAGFTPYPYIEFTEFSNWQGVVDWALTHYKQQPVESGALTDYVEQLKRQTTTPQEYIEAAIRFVQNDVRYFGIETGQNSHIPSKPSEVFERRYGDCKDKTMLLNFLLAQQNIEASPALVANQARGSIRDNLPSPGQFDHVITHFTFNDKEYWIDGTRSFQHGTLDNIGVSDFEQALIIKPEQTALSPVVIQHRHRSQLHVNEKFSATGNYEQPVKLDVSIKFYSHEAEYIRSALAGQPLTEISKHYVDFYSKHFPGIEQTQEIEARDDTTSNVVELIGKYQINDFWQADQGRVNTPMYGEFISSYVQLPSTIQRKFPLGLYHPMEISQNVEVIFPEAIEWNFENNPMKIENDAIKYFRHIQFKDKSLKVTHQYQTKAKSIAPINVPTYVRDIKDIRDAIYLSVYNGVGSSKSLRSIIRNLLNREIDKTSKAP